jgi:hypothetical protein
MKFVHAVVLASSALTLAACGADDVASPGEGSIVVVQPPSPPPPPPPSPPPPPTGPADACPAGTANVGIVNNLRNCQLSGTITGNLVLRNLRGVIYSLQGAVNVGADIGGDGQRPGGAQAILTVEPGTVIFGSSGADALVVNRGSQLFAEGTAQSPIIFTSRANVEGNARADSIGQWGGVVLLGRAPTNRCEGTATPNTPQCQLAIEGLSGSFFGGNVPADNSGRLRYVQIRYPGFEVSPGNELNGLTLGGVGTGTTIEYVQVHNSSDDGIEWFGGRVNTRYMVITGADDDSLDTEVGYQGFNQFIVVLQRSTGGDRTIEGDTSGREADRPRSFPRFANVTLVGRRPTEAIVMRGGTDYALYNAVITTPTTATAPATPPACIRMDNDVLSVTPRRPIFESVFLTCASPFRAGGAPITVADMTAVFNAGSNNTAAGTLSLTNDIVNGANETAVTPFNVAGVNAFFQQVPYIGAVRNAQDTWFAGWTCGLQGQRACTDAPPATGN